MKPIAILHEHPDWFRPLFNELDRRGVPYVRLDAAAHRYDPHETSVPWSLVFNRASPSAHLRGRVQTTFHTLHWLRHLQRIGVPVVNGAKAYEMETSKALQLDVLSELGIPFPKSRVINHVSQAVAAAEGLRYPVLVKANVGGSGAGITRFETPGQLAAAGSLDLGVDHTALVQECAPLEGGFITRVEVLAGKILYGIHVYPDVNSYNLCPGDACQTADGRELARGACPVDAPRSGLRVEAATVTPAVAEAVLRIARAVELDVGGIELLTDARDGKAYIYDINALSNFVADPVRVVGFDPFARLADELVARASRGPRAEAA